ncbi:hypothetical protein V2W45_1473219 [Cenococcum geophilum]
MRLIKFFKCLSKKSAKRPGPKPTPLEARPYKQHKPISRIQRSYSRKLRASCTKAETELPDGTVYCPPTAAEALAYWKIPEPIIKGYWFNNFIKRYGILRRRVTKQALKLPEEYIKVINSFLRFIRRNSQPYGPQLLHQIMHPNCFDLSTILNLNETPIPFKYLDGYTYNFYRAKTISSKSNRSGWNKRQATLILYIFINITVTYNKTAYNNKELFDKWITKELCPLLNRLNRLNNLLIMDKLRNSYITTALILSGYTSLLQPLDTTVNKPFKGWLREATKEYLKDRRVITTYKADLISKAFIKCGISIYANNPVIKQEEDFKELLVVGDIEEYLPRNNYRILLQRGLIVSRAKKVLIKRLK